MFLLFAALLALVFYLVRSGRMARFAGYGPRGPGGKPGDGVGAARPWGGPWQQPRPEDDALKTLADRLASGDITPDEYLERVSVLRQQG